MRKYKNIFLATFVGLVVIGVSFFISEMTTNLSHKVNANETPSTNTTTLMTHEIESSSYAVIESGTDESADITVSTNESSTLESVVEETSYEDEEDEKYYNEPETVDAIPESSAPVYIDQDSTESESEEGESQVENEYEEENKDDSNYEYLGHYYVTGYCSGSCCNGGNANKTASGAPLSAWYTVAMKGIDFGTHIYIDGLGEFVVQDRGVGYKHVDVCVNEHGEAYDITGHYDVYIIN